MEKHTHNGKDSDRINLSDSQFQVLSSPPTHKAKEGTAFLYYDGVSVYRFYVMINKIWKYVALTTTTSASQSLSPSKSPSVSPSVSPS